MQVNKALAATKSRATIDVLICCAGASYPGRFLEQDLDVHETTMQLNYFGSLYAIKAVAAEMVARRQGRIVIVSSALMAVGFVGFTTYAPSKWALRGLADCLRNEFLPFGIHVHIAAPPDTNTPGYENEMKLKPPEAVLASQAAGEDLYTPEQVASAMMSGLEKGKYHLPSPNLVPQFPQDPNELSGTDARVQAAVGWRFFPSALA
ncbi:hypothetical protein WJX72_006831 [[Myrmecia] bisecta]|uniref:3-ketodihydrosphingosine reductase n=1 Tax=[Myrmecia] bisecta TaxID=41462 RepID=A0AAW1R765_9CHLO